MFEGTVQGSLFSYDYTNVDYFSRKSEMGGGRLPGGKGMM